VFEVYDFRRFATGGLVVVALAVFAAAPGARAEEGAAGHEGAAAEHGGGHEGPLQLNWTDFSNRHTPPIVALFINSIILFGLLVYYGRKPMRGYLAERRRKVEEEVDQAFEDKVRAEGKLRGVVLRTKNIDEELAQLREDLLKVGQDERDRLIADAGARAEKIRKEAEATAAEAERGAQRALRAKMIEEALAGARQALQAKLGTADQSRLAEEFVRRLPSQGAQAK
jgi:F-type H+-transporting ATPase subunit b